MNETLMFFRREDMEKVNIVFHNNGTVSYQHKKILNFIPEMSRDGDLKVVVPNIPLLVRSPIALLQRVLIIDRLEKFLLSASAMWR
jgi:hypothetical protein